MLTCNICGVTSNEVVEYEDYKNSTPSQPKPINLCFKCLSKVRYCSICNTLVLESAEHGGKEVCMSCVKNKNLTACKFCSCITNKVDKHGACKVCSPQLKYCDVCKTPHLKLNLTEEDKNLCDKCIKDYKYIFCDSCKKHVLPANFNKSEGYCQKCISTIKTCVMCGQKITLGSTFKEVAPGIYTCRSCVTASSCCTCGTGSGRFFNVILRLREHECNLNLCYDCYINKKYGIIKGYSYKPKGKFKKVDAAEHPTLFIGIENEVNFSDHMPHERVSLIFDDKEDHYYVKRDGSLSNGFEIVTHPMNYEYIMSKFPISSIFPKDFGIKKSSECGMHIHMSKDAFSNAHLFKFMQFFLNEPDFCEKIAQRKANSYCSKLGKTEIVEKAMRKSGGARNQVNLGPAHTVEVRSFAGAITPEQYFKNIEFVYALFCFTKKMSIAHLNVEAFETFIAKTPEKYPNLIKFLK